MTAAPLPPLPVKPAAICGPKVISRRPILDIKAGDHLLVAPANGKPDIPVQVTTDGHLEPIGRVNTHGLRVTTYDTVRFGTHHSLVRHLLRW